MENEQKIISALTLALAYLTSWEEKYVLETVHRAWRGYDFNTLDQLQKDGLIDFSYKAKSLYFTEKGKNKALKFIKALKKLKCLEMQQEASENFL